MSGKTRMLTLIVIIAIVGGLLLIYQRESKHPAAPKPATTNVSLGQIKSQTITQTIHGYGTIIAPDAQDILAQADGTISHIDYQAGQWVTQGTVLFDLDTSDLQATLLSKRAALKLAQHKLTMYKALFRKNVIAKFDYDQALTEFNQARQAYQMALKNRRFMRIKAPISGFIAASPLANGSVVSQNTFLTHIVPKSDYQVQYYLAARWRGYLKPGQTIHFTSNNLAPQTAQISYIAPNVGQNQSIEIRASLQHIPANISPGMLVDVQQNLTPQARLVIPRANVGSDAKGFYLYSVKQHKVVQQYFSVTGLTANGLLIIKHGLKAGDQFINSSITNLSPGQTVMVTHASS